MASTRNVKQSPRLAEAIIWHHVTTLYAAESQDQEEASSASPSDGDNDNDESAKLSLQEKMKAWEATEEEVKAATLGGVVPGSRSDAFDVGLYIAFPIMVLSGLAFAIFPLIMGNLDVDSVGPPPTV